MARPTILAYRLSADRLSQLKRVCMRLGLLVRAVPQEEEGQPIGALCGVGDRIPDAPEAPCAEEMLVFCHMSNAAVQQFLLTARQQRVQPFALKAVLTPTNAAWNAQTLCAELLEERAAVLSGQSLPHDN